MSRSSGAQLLEAAEAPTAIAIDITGVEQGMTTHGINFNYDGGNGVCLDAEEAEEIARALEDAAKLLRERT